MLKIVSFRLLVTLWISLGIVCYSQSMARTTTISGQIQNFPGGPVQLFVEEDINRKKSRLIAELASDKNGRFKLEKDLPPHVYTLRVGSKKSAMLALEKGQEIFVAGDALGKEQLRVTGSEDTAKLEAYEQFRKASLGRLVVSVRDRIKQLKAGGATDDDPQLRQLQKLEIENYASHKNELLEFVRREMGTSIAIYPTSLRWDGNRNIPFLTELAKRFEMAHPGTDVSARVSEKVKTLVSNSIGGNAANIVMPDKNGVARSLSAVDARYILIDFWGSWCPPCRHESQLLTELYRSFRSSGFEIFGVGLESDRDLWLKAIAQDKRTWINVSSFQEFETPAAFDYAITSLPANVLIDRSGKIIARNLHGDELRSTITKLFSVSATR